MHDSNCKHKPYKIFCSISSRPCNLIMCFTVFTTFISTLALYLGTLRAARFIHDHLLYRILRAPMEFFDTTLTGRILNRFSNDTKEVDTDLPATLRAFGACVFGVYWKRFFMWEKLGDDGKLTIWWRVALKKYLNWKVSWLEKNVWWLKILWRLSHIFLILYVCPIFSYYIFMSLCT